MIVDGYEIYQPNDKNVIITNGDKKSVCNLLYHKILNEKELERLFESWKTLRKEEFEEV